MNEMTSCTLKLIDQQQFLYTILNSTIEIFQLYIWIMDWSRLLESLEWFIAIIVWYAPICWSLLICTVWQIVPGSTYIFTTMVTNMMDLSSISVNTHVTRSHDLKPISVQLKLMSRKHPDPQRPLKMVAVVTPSACSGIDMQEVHNIIL